MTDEVAISVRFEFQSSDANMEKVDVSIDRLLCDVTGTDMLHNIQTVGTSEEALLLGDVTPGWFFARNLDATNFVSLRQASGAADFAKILAGETCGPFKFDADCTAPFVIADTGACRLEYWILDI